MFAKSIEVDGGGAIWIIADDDKLYKYNGNQWIDQK